MKIYKKTFIFFFLFLLGLSYLVLRGDAETQLSREIYKIDKKGEQIDPKVAFTLLTKYNIGIIAIEKIAYTLNKYGFSKSPIESYQLIRGCADKQIENFENCKVSLRFLESFMQIARISTPMCDLNSGDIVLYGHSDYINEYELHYVFSEKSGWTSLASCRFKEEQNDLTALTAVEIQSRQLNLYNDTEVIDILGNIEKIKVEINDNMILIEKYTQHGTDKSQYLVNSQREVKFIDVVDGQRY